MKHVSSLLLTLVVTLLAVAGCANRAVGPRPVPPKRDSHHPPHWHGVDITLPTKITLTGCGKNIFDKHGNLLSVTSTSDDLIHLLKRPKEQALIRQRLQLALRKPPHCLPKRLVSAWDRWHAVFRRIVRDYYRQRRGKRLYDERAKLRVTLNLNRP